MPKKKPKPKPVVTGTNEALESERSKIESERFAFLSKLVADAKLLAALALLASLMSVLLIMTVVVPMNDKLDILTQQSNSIAFYQFQDAAYLNDLYHMAKDNAAQIDNASSFCYGYDPYGKLGAFIDDRKLTPCAGVNASWVG